MKKFLDIHNVTKKERLALACICMEGGVSYWFRFWKKKTKNPSWEDLMEALIRRFEGRNRGSVFEKLTAMRQKGMMEEYI